MDSSFDQGNGSEVLPGVTIQDLLDSVPGRVAVLDSRGRIILVNERWKDFGLENDADPGIVWIGKDYLDISKSVLGFSMEAASMAYEGIQRVMAGKQSGFELEYPRYRKGKMLWFSMSVSGLKWGKAKWVSVIHNEITEKRQAENERLHNVLSMRATFEQAAVGIAHVTPEGRFIRINKKFCEIVGYSHEEMLTLSFQDITHPDDLETDLVQANLLLEGKQDSYTLEKRYFHKMGQVVWIRLTVSLVRDLSGRPLHFVSVIENIDRRKQAEEALRESEKKFRRLMEQSPVSIQIHTPDGKLQQCNAAYETLFALSKESLAGLYQKYNVLEDQQAEKLGLISYIRKVFRGEMVSFPEYEYNGIDTLKTLDVKNPVSRRCWVKTSGFPLMDPNGQVTHAVFLSEDITEQKRAEKKLMESEQSYRSLIEQAQDGIVLLQDGLIKFVNSSMTAFTGYSVDELLNRPFVEFLADDQIEKVREIYRKRMSNEAVPSIYESAISHKNGTCLDTEFNAGVTTYGGKPADLVIIRDIRERKKAEEERSRLFRLSTDLIGIGDFNGNLIQLNPAWEAVLGHSSDELLARPFLDFIHPDDRNKSDAEVGKLSSGHKTIDFENRYIHKDGSLRHISWTATPLPEAGIFYCIGRDVTQRKKNEEQILGYQQNLKDLAEQLTLAEEKQNKLIATSLHDHVGQLLASSRLQLAALHDGMSKTEILSKTGQISKGLLQAIQATREVIFDLSPPQLNEIGLYAATADWMDEEVETKHGIKARLTGDDRVYNLDDNMRVLLFRSIRELLMNVVKHARANCVDVNIQETAKDLEITVRDDGKGFHYNPKMMRLKSSGIGLFSIQERAASFGGYLDIESSPGKGTSIKLSIPLSGSVS